MSRAKLNIGALCVTVIVQAPCFARFISSPSPFRQCCYPTTGIALLYCTSPLRIRSACNLPRRCARIASTLLSPFGA